MRAAPAVELPNASTTPVVTSLPPIHRNAKKTSRSSKSSSGASSSTNVKEAPFEFDRVKKRKTMQNDVPSREHHAIRQTMAKTAASAADTDSGRPRTETGNGRQGEEEEEEKEIVNDEEEEEEEEDYPEEPEELRALRETEEKESMKTSRGERKRKKKTKIVGRRGKRGEKESEEGSSKKHQNEEEQRKRGKEEEDGDEKEEDEEGKGEQKEMEDKINGADQAVDEHVEHDKGNGEGQAVDEHGQNGEGQAVDEHGQNGGVKAVDEHDQNGDGQAEDEHSQKRGIKAEDEHSQKGGIKAVDEHGENGGIKAVDEHGQSGEGQAEDQHAKHGGLKAVNKHDQTGGLKAVDEHVHHGNRAPAEQKPFMLGVYSDELEQILYGAAAVKIQSAWRGYSTRKELQKRQFGVPPQVMVNGARRTLSSHRHGTNKQQQPPDKKKADMYKSNEQHLAAVHNVVKPTTPRHDVAFDSSSEREEEEDTYGTEFMVERNKERLSWETAEAMVEQPAPGDRQPPKNPRREFSYTVTVITGNRWAADTEAHLYIEMHGSDHDSGRLWLRQEFTNWLHNSVNGPRFRQNQSDSFTFRLPSRLGTINRLTVGHERHGYGAGVFIDRILVTEDEGDEAEEEQPHGDAEGQQIMPSSVEQCADCRQFLFLCNRWFDSGQVDGKLERNVRLSAIYMINTIPLDGSVTRGRWEFVFHGGTTDGRGGTSSQLAITGYGTAGQSTTSGLYDSRMATAPSEALMQVDFGNIGELLKVRVALDGGDGTSPDYFLNFVEFKDLDSDENFVVMCGKWLRWRSAKKGDQPFRELIAFHIGVEPLPLITYEGKIRAVHSTLNCFIAEELRLELHGDLGDTGQVVVPMNAAAVTATTTNKSPSAAARDEGGTDAENADAVQWTDIPFRMEAVSVGRVGGARVHFVPNLTGKQIFEGLLMLQNVFKKQNVWPLLGANSSFVFSQIRLTESVHTPYRYVLSRSQLHELRCDQEQNHTVTKELLTTEMEGISTKLSNRKNQSTKMPRKWFLQMALSEGSTILPQVFLCWEKHALAMTPVDTSFSDGILSYQLDSANDLEPFIKVRILSDGQTLLSAPTSVPNGEDKVGLISEETSNSEMPFSYVDKVRICDTANGDELRFPSADCILQRHSVYELPVVWPDRSPMPVLIYSVRIATGPATVPSNPELVVWLNLFGEHGDVGQRMLIRDDQEMQQAEASADHHNPKQQQEMPPLFAPKTSCSFEFEAVSIGDIHSAEVVVHTTPNEEADFYWECAEMVVTDFRGRSAPFYAFKFVSPFTAQWRVQSADVLPFTDAL